MSVEKWEKPIEIWPLIMRLFPICRSLTGSGNFETLRILQEECLPTMEIKHVLSGSKVFDWEVPAEWAVSEAYVKNSSGKKIIDFRENNLHLVSYSGPFCGRLGKKELLDHIHTLPSHPDWVPYRTTYYKEDWGFCTTENLINSDEFSEPFEVCVRSTLDGNGRLIWGECLKKGETDKEILISTYCCHPSLANDNLSGLVVASHLFSYLSRIKTKFSYRLVIAPETIGAISFLSQANTAKILAGMVITCVGGPDRLSIKQGFDEDHWINAAAHRALLEHTGGDYDIYPFEPDGSDERQYSTPKLRIVTPSIHRSKYYEYDEYHTSADDLSFITEGSLQDSLAVHKRWINEIEEVTVPLLRLGTCEIQLGKRGLYPHVGGTFRQSIIDTVEGSTATSDVSHDHLEAFNWIMHMADGSRSVGKIAEISGKSSEVVMEAVNRLKALDLVELL